MSNNSNLVIKILESIMPIVDDFPNSNPLRGAINVKLVEPGIIEGE